MHQKKIFSIQILEGKHVLICQSVIYGYRTADPLSGQFHSCALAELQHGLIKDSSYDINIFSQIFQDLPGALQAVHVWDHLQLNVRTFFLYLCP